MTPPRSPTLAPTALADDAAPCRRGAAPGPVPATGELAALFRVLGDPTRLEIVARLAAGAGERCVCELEACFELSQPTVSHHLRILREAGIVAARRRGTWVYYSLAPGLRERLQAFQERLRPGPPAG